jgi:radical SAM superfamily enzyme YgiQ (UPF0313 family)
MKEQKIKKVALVYLTAEECFQIHLSCYDLQRRPILGLQYLCAVLEKNGIKTDIFDQSVFPFNSNQFIEKLMEYDLVGFYCSDPQEKKIKAWTVKIKKRFNIPILVGGPSTLTNPSFLNHGCDIVVHGEGEITTQQIIEYYNGTRRLNDIKGISYKKNDQIITTPPQELIKNLDELPFPDRSKIDINSYYDYFLFDMKKPYITMITSRGCAYRCSFCTSCNIWEHKYRARSVDNVLSEIGEVVEKYNVKYVAFQDDIFGITNDWIEEFCTKLMMKPYKIRWMAIFHPFSVQNDTERILKLMKKAGCSTLSFGLQSAHPRILKNINRHPSEPEKLKKFLKIANKIGFVTSLSYILGLPGDTMETIQTTIDYSVNCGSMLANYNILGILRGSEIDTQYKNKKVCDLTTQDLEKIRVRAARKFYTKPKIILKIAFFIINNPGWLIRIGIKLPSMLERMGFIKARMG